jgi:hypothetical protein
VFFVCSVRREGYYILLLLYEGYKLKTLTVIVVVLFSSVDLMAQHSIINTPPSITYANKPEMTEIWEPEIKK